jgi:hypothetical protein
VIWKGYGKYSWPNFEVPSFYTEEKISKPSLKTTRVVGLWFKISVLGLQCNRQGEFEWPSVSQ